MALFCLACSDVASPVSSPAPVSSSNSVSYAPADFVVLASAAATCTAGSITGDVGTFLGFPVGSLTQTGCPLTGTAHIGDYQARHAFDAFLDTYAALTPQIGDLCTTLTGTLDGVILAPGDYCFDVSATVTGVLTLDGPSNGTWNIKIGASGTGALTATNFSVVMAGGGQGCNVTWWVANAATATTSNVLGNLLAGAPITLTGGTFIGHAKSKTDVTITGTAVSGC